MIIPNKLKKGDEVRIIAPCSSLALISKEVIDIAVKRLEQEGYKVSFSKNCSAIDMFMSSSVNERVEDIHQAFADTNVKAIFSVLGGYNSNQLLSYLDYKLIKENPKILCGYSDMTALQNAITAKTGLITYSGLHFATWGMRKEFEYNFEYFKKCLVDDDAFIIEPSQTWSDDVWYKNQEDRKILKNEGFWILNKGNSEGKIYGGNLCTLNLLQGTEYMPNIENSILFLEDDGFAGEASASMFDRDLQSLMHKEMFKKVKGLLIGRFQKKSQMNLEKLKSIIESKKELRNIPIVANVDFGHTNPMFTFPIGGSGRMRVDEEVMIEIMEH